MSFTQEQLRAIYAMAMGYGTESGRTPYKLNLVTGPKAGNSGYSVGVIQVDFGAQGEKVAASFLETVKSWAIATRLTIDGKLFQNFEAQDIAKRLISNRDRGGVVNLALGEIEWVNPLMPASCARKRNPVFRRGNRPC